jgi:hypothetical protein
MIPIIRPLCRLAARESGITVQEIFSRSRCRRIARPRFAAMKVAHENGRSYCLIARHVRFRDHTSVIHAVRRATELERADPSFAALIAKLRGAFSPISTPTFHPSIDTQIHPHAGPQIAPRKSVAECGSSIADRASEGA